MAKKIVSDTTVRGLKAVSKRAEIPDSEIRGLYLVQQPPGARDKKGSKSWALRYRHHGKPRKLTLGPWVPGEIDKTRKTASKYKDLIKIGKDPKLELDRTRLANKVLEASTVEVAGKNFIEKYAQVKTKPGTARETERLLKRHIYPEIGSHPISEITRAQITRILDHVEAESGFYTANRVLAAVRKMFNWVVTRDEMPFNPIVQGMTRGKEEERKRPLSNDELKVLWRAAETEGYPYGPWFKFTLMTGQRTGETSKMKWVDIDLKSGVWTQPAETTKNKRENAIPLSDLALGIITEILSDKESGQSSEDRKEYVFSPRNGESYLQNLSKFKTRLDKVSGVQDWRFHDLRHSWTTVGGDIGIDYFIRERILNHALPGEGRRYDKGQYHDQKKAALDTWSRYLTGTILSDDDSSNIVTMGNRA